MQSIADQKKSLRRELLSVLRALPSAAVAEASAAVCTQLFKLLQRYPYTQYRIALGFVPWFPGEVQLRDLYIKQENRQWGFPHLEHADEMRYRLVGTEWYRRISQQSGPRPPEPRHEDGPEYTVADAAHTIVIVPGLAFDRAGYRLGRGKSYYDRFLNTPGMQSAIRIGVGLPEQLVEGVPREPHDAQLDYVLAGAGLFALSRAV